MSEAAPTTTTKRFQFPRWANYALPAIAVALVGGLFYAPTLFVLGASPKTTAVGYAPDQPVPYSHAIHVGKLGMDCRYCHNTVESAAFAALPATQTCMNCHRPGTVDARGDWSGGGIRAVINKKPNEVFKPLHDSWRNGTPVEWVKIHDLPDYAYFNHSAHVNRGVGCVSCHGRIDQMDKVYQAQPLSMGWCLDCHREPEKHLRPLTEITNMNWNPTSHPSAIAKGLKDPEKDKDAAQELVGKELKAAYGTREPHYMTSCYTCHR